MLFLLLLFQTCLQDRRQGLLSTVKNRQYIWSIDESFSDVSGLYSEKETRKIIYSAHVGLELDDHQHLEFSASLDSYLWGIAWLLPYARCLWKSNTYSTIALLHFFLFTLRLLKCKSLLGQLYEGQNFG